MTEQKTKHNIVKLSDQLKEIRSEKAWINYILIWNESKHGGEGGFDKPPVNPHSLRDGSSTDPERWTTFDHAVSNIGKTATIHYKDGKEISGEVSGVGLILEAVGLVGVDFDGVIREIDGETVFDEESRQIIEYLDAYTEKSPSGTGVHVLIKGKKPKNTLSKIKNVVRLESGLEYVTEYEMYDRGRYFTFTGDILDGFDHGLEERQEQLNKVYRLFEVRQAKKARSLSRVVSSPQGGHGEKATPDETDLELWEKMFRSRRGAEIRKLFDGDLSVCGGDHSACDLALCNHLAYWTNLDESRIDRMFRQSSLLRDKWTKNYIIPKYGKSYRDWTIETAISGKTSYREYTEEERKAYGRRKRQEEIRAKSNKNNTRY